MLDLDAPASVLLACAPSRVLRVFHLPNDYHGVGMMVPIIVVVHIVVVPTVVVVMVVIVRLRESRSRKEHDRG